MFGPLVSSEWLNKNINNVDLVVLDASRSTNKSNLHSEFDHHKIPQSRFFDLKEKFSNNTSRFPNTFPTAEQFENECRNLGINTSSIIVVYDNIGVYWSPRVWWMFKTMGHKNVFVLDGGLPDWVESGSTTVKDYLETSTRGNFTASLNPKKVKDFDFIQSNIPAQNHVIVDVRSKDRFKGTLPEPREGLRSGHIPNSMNLPYADVLKNGKYKPKEELITIFENAKVDDRPIAFSCGSGVTACIVLLAADMVLDNDTSVYDGSWTEYGCLTNEDHI